MISRIAGCLGAELREVTKCDVGPAEAPPLTDAFFESSADATGLDREHIKQVQQQVEQWFTDSDEE